MTVLPVRAVLLHRLNASSYATAMAWSSLLAPSLGATASQAGVHRGAGRASAETGVLEHMRVDLRKQQGGVCKSVATTRYGHLAPLVALWLAVD